MPPVIEAGGARVGVAGEELHVLKRHALGEQVGDDGDAERVGRKRRGQRSADRRYMGTMLSLGRSLSAPNRAPK